MPQKYTSSNLPSLLLLPHLPNFLNLPNLLHLPNLPNLPNLFRTSEKKIHHLARLWKSHVR